jgi:broad specificity phosphatase PhoE
MPEKTVWIARHGHRFDFAYPEWFLTAERRYDPALSDQGFVQVQQLANRLKQEPIDHLFCSPFLRAIQTAQPIAQLLDLPLKIERGLGEWLNPDWMTEYPQTSPIEELIQKYSIDQPYSSRLIPTYPESESAMMERMASIAGQLVTEFSGNLLLVGHGATVGGITAGLMGENLIWQAPLACLTKIVYLKNQWKIELKADISHLESF